VLTIYLLASNWVALFSGLLLMAAGVTVWSVRFRYRRLQRHIAECRHGEDRRRGPDRRTGDRRGQPSSVVEAMHAKAGFVRLNWRPEYQSGIPAIDAQHRLLFESGNALLNAILDKQDKLDVELLLEELVGHVEHHFADEERILAQVGHPLDAAHRFRHNELLARAKRLGELFHRGELTTGDLFTFVANDLVMQHIATEDPKYPAPPPA
jgi:hemerythrin-like metal-binding protein